MTQVDLGYVSNYKRALVNGMCLVLGSIHFCLEQQYVLNKNMHVPLIKCVLQDHFLFGITDMLISTSYDVDILFLTMKHFKLKMH